MFTLFNKGFLPLEPYWLVIIVASFLMIGIVKVHWVVLANLTLVTVVAITAQFVTDSYVISSAAFVECMGWLVFFVSLLVSPKGKHSRSVLMTLKLRT